MRVVLTNLSNTLYENSRLQLNESARRNGIHEIKSYDFPELKGTEFYNNNKKILDQPRGIGYWLWKPYIILEAMKDLSDGDVVIYSDCGIEIIDHLTPLVTICEKQQPVVLFANGNFINSIWTKRDCFILMDCDNKAYWYNLQCDAAFALFRKSSVSTEFLQAWLKYGSDERILTDLPNTCGKKNLPGFIEHRWDQSILSLLAHKFHLPLFRMPTQFGNHYKSPEVRVQSEFNCVNQLNQKQLSYYSVRPYYNSPYYQLLNHHRSKNGEQKANKKTFNVSRGIKKKWRKLSGQLSQWYIENFTR